MSQPTLGARSKEPQPRSMGTGWPWASPLSPPWSALKSWVVVRQGHSGPVISASGFRVSSVKSVSRAYSSRGVDDHMRGRRWPACLLDGVSCHWGEDPVTVLVMAAQLAVTVTQRPVMVLGEVTSGEGSAGAEALWLRRACFRWGRHVWTRTVPGSGVRSDTCAHTHTHVCTHVHPCRLTGHPGRPAALTTQAHRGWGLGFTGWRP